MFYFLNAWSFVEHFMIKGYDWALDGEHYSALLWQLWLFINLKKYDPNMLWSYS